jgi:predicted transcriptional regulator
MRPSVSLWCVASRGLFGTIMLTISDQIRVQIRESGLSQREIAARSGVSLSIITYFLSGKSITTGNLDRIFAVVAPKSKKTSRT